MGKFLLNGVDKVRGRASVGAGDSSACMDEL